MFTIMGSGPIILLMCSVIAVAAAHPYTEQLLTAQDLTYPQEYRTVDHRPVTYRKHFHFFAAPEEADNFDEEIPEELLKKDINVVVIKAPENNKATTTIARLAKALAEEKTSIYVLNKEPNLKEISSEIERLKEQKTTRPDVHFIKYKTSEEADLAARNIQLEYDALRGPSEIHHQLTAALHSYVGLLDSTGVHQMQVVSFYGRPVLRPLPESQPPPESSFYLPPEEDASNPSAISDDTASQPEVIASGVYLPPESDSNNLATPEDPIVDEYSSTDILTLDLDTFTENVIASSTIPEPISPKTTTKNEARETFRYSFSGTTTPKPTKHTSVTASLPSESSLANEYLPPGENNLRNKRSN